MEKVYARTKTFQKEMVSGFCPGCMHGTVFKLIGEVMEELGIVDKTTCVLGVGCCGLAMEYITYDNTTSPHGRACAVATGIKRSTPDAVVYTYQGDGDLASIGLAETMSAANRGENITVIFVNNGIYGMTGGQMAPTTLVGMKATTAPQGRDPKEHGYPMHMCEILNQLTAPYYLERTSCNNPANVNKTKAAIKKAFQNQLDGKGFSMVEIVTSCPTNWGLDTIEALDFLENNMLKEFPLGVVRDKSKEGALMERNRMVAGFGGQGVMTLGKFLAEATCDSTDMNVTFFPSYGAEQRGGTANCYVVISDEDIGAPLGDSMDDLIVMNDPSLNKFLYKLVPGGTLFINSSIVKSEITRDDIQVVKVPVTEMALEMGNPKVLNIIMLGAYVGYTQVVPENVVWDTIQHKLGKKPKLLPLNKQAFEAGLKIGKEAQNRQ